MRISAVAAEWGRVITAMVTPFDNASRIDLRAARKLARGLLSSGSSSLVLAGTTGESPALSHEEKRALWTEVIDEVGRDAAIIAGSGTNSTADSVKLTQEAERAGARGVMLVAPYYNKPTQEGLYAHFKEVADSTSLPVIVYNVPSRTGCNLLPDTLAALAADVPNIAAVKEASGSLDQVSECVRQVRAKRKDFLVYSGDDSLTLPILSVGGHGVVSVASHVAGNAISRMIDAYLSGDAKAAREMHLRLFPLFKALFIVSNPIPVKTALGMLGEDVGGFRLPMTEMPEGARSALGKALTSSIEDGIIDDRLLNNHKRNI